MTTPLPEKLAPDKTPSLDGKSVNGHHGHNGHHHPGQPGADLPEASAFTPPTRRNSFWPFLLDLGVVTMLVSWLFPSTDKASCISRVIAPRRVNASSLLSGLDI